MNKHLSLFIVYKDIFVLLILSFALATGFVPVFIRYAKKYKLAHKIRAQGPSSHSKKFGTSNMGGIVIVCSIVTSTYCFCNNQSVEYLVFLFTLIGFALLGFWDDLMKIRGAKNGLSAKQKILCQVLISFLGCMILRQYSTTYSTFCYIPFTCKTLDLSYLYDLFCILTICGASNAVNITDGLDGLAVLPICMTAAALFLLLTSVFQAVTPYAHRDLMLACAGIIGASLGFAIYNFHPAKIFMGDTGSLSLGASLGIISVITKHQLFLAIIGGVFVIEMLSVIIQVSYFKISKGKRIFRMAPIHHHFEQIGISEPKIVKGFWILSLAFAALGVSSKAIAFC